MVFSLTVGEVRELLDKASCPEEVFGPADQLQKKYIYLASICHPDRCADTDLWAQLNQWKMAADSKIDEGSYGDKTPAYGLDYIENPVDTDKYKIILTGRYGEGMVATVHRAHMPHLSSRSAPYFKVVRNHRDNDLMDREWRNLKIVTARTNGLGKEFYDKQRNYVPYPVMQVTLRTPDGRALKCNAFNSPKGQALTLEQLMNLAQFRDGLPRVHAYWIARQLLLTLHMAHSRRIGHGGLTPAQVLVYPAEHGHVLLGWTSSFLLGSEKPPVMDKKYQPFYPPNVKAIKTTGAAFDLFMWAKTMMHCCHDYPGQLVHLFEGCYKGLGRPTNASKLYDEFGSIIESTDGPRRFVEFIV